MSPECGISFLPFWKSFSINTTKQGEFLIIFQRIKYFFVEILKTKFKIFIYGLSHFEGKLFDLLQKIQVSVVNNC